jgi:hypothetical protein
LIVDPLSMIPADLSAAPPFLLLGLGQIKTPGRETGGYEKPGQRRFWFTQL